MKTSRVVVEVAGLHSRPKPGSPITIPIVYGNSYTFDDGTEVHEIAGEYFVVHVHGSTWINPPSPYLDAINEYEDEVNEEWEEYWAECDEDPEDWA